MREYKSIHVVTVLNGLVFFATALLFSVVSVRAADIAKEDGVLFESDIIRINGEIVDGDFQKFASLASMSNNAIVVLNSPGGLLWPALDIALMSKARGFATYVEAGVNCLSGCANIWLSGTQRYIERGGVLGFHPPHRIEAGEPVASSSLSNALLGWHYAQIGLSREVVARIFQQDFSGMSEFTSEDLTQIGIDVSALPAGSLKSIREEATRTLSDDKRFLILTAARDRASTLSRSANVSIERLESGTASQKTDDLVQLDDWSEGSQALVTGFLFGDVDATLIVHNLLTSPLRYFSMKYHADGKCKPVNDIQYRAVLHLPEGVPAGTTGAIKISEPDVQKLLRTFGWDKIGCLKLDAAVP